MNRRSTRKARAAFGKFNADYTAAHHSATAALTAVLGEAIVEALHFQPVEADGTLPYEGDPYECGGG